MSVTKLFDIKQLTNDEIQQYWEEAYVRFETPQQEIEKFTSRLKKLGLSDWDRHAQVVEIFCGRGNGLKALERLGFTNLEGVDISERLVRTYDGPALMKVADCRSLPFDDESRDAIIVQGGLHHLPSLPDDLDKTLSEIRRVLKVGGRFVMVEPWLTPFLRAIHFLSEVNLVRTVSEKFDAFATMTHYEASTYFNWLESDKAIIKLLKKYFDVSYLKSTFGKIYFTGQPKP